MAIKIEENVNLARYTTFQIGGEADYFCRIKDREELIEALDWAKENGVKYRILGGGSNVLISDKGFEGLIILNRAGNYQVKGDRIFADSGVNLSKIARETVSLGLKGLDFATNIPGTIGGAAAGNAGAYGQDMSSVVLWVETWQDGVQNDYLKDELRYTYRSSILKNAENRVVLGVALELEKGDRDEMMAAMEEDVKKRQNHYAGANAGSFFMNIEAADLNPDQREKLKDFIVHEKVSIGKLVESLGLKGLKVGGAMVSYDHGNVILNVGGAKAADVIELERTIKDKVMAAYGIILRPEVTKIGEF